MDTPAAKTEYYLNKKGFLPIFTNNRKKLKSAECKTAIKISSFFSSKEAK